jgi:PAS domain-containing protein/predicted negative regulator of RcsB-dependent stress response
MGIARANILRRPLATALLATALIAATLSSPSHASTCDAGSRPARVLPDPVECARRAGSAAAPADPSALIAAAGDAIERAEFDRADGLLDCADARLADRADPALGIALVRMRGNVLFRRERIMEAVPYYDCALSMSRSAGDAHAEAIALNNLGTAWRRLGEPLPALEALDRALTLQTRRSGLLYANTMMNLADLHRDLRDTETAMREYRLALAAFQAEGAHAGVGHVLESMGVLAFDRNAMSEAEGYLRDALRAHGQAGHASVYLMRTYAGLIRVSLQAERPDDARRWAAEALDFARRTRAQLPAPLQVQIAEVERRGGRSVAATRRLQTALDALSTKDPDRLAVLDALADLRARAGDAAGALALTGQARDLQRALDEAKQAQSLAVLRFRVDRDRAVQALANENARERQRVRIVSWSAFAILVALTAWFLHQLWRVRLREVARRAQHDADVAHYRRLAEALRLDHRVLQAALDSRDDALCLLDGSGRVLAVNAGATALIRRSRTELVGTPFVDALEETTRDAWHHALDRLDETGSAGFDIRIAGTEAPLQATLSDHGSDEGVLLLRLAGASSAASGDGGALPGFASVSEEGGLEAGFREALVELMLSAVEVWERASGLNRLELAERSRIWRVSIDGGRLRARTLDRYLSLAKLPRNPHWRDVLRTAYFVLGQADIDEAARARLQARVDAVIGFTRRSAMV